MLKNSKTNSSQLKKAVESLTQELNAKTQRIEELQAELASKNIRIQELDAAVTDLNAVKSELTAENEAKAKTVAEQDKALNTCVVCVRYKERTERSEDFEWLRPVQKRISTERR